MSPFGDPQNSETLFAFGVEEEGKRYLLQTAGWTKFFAIMGFVVSGIMLIAALVMFISGATTKSYYTSYSFESDKGAYYVGMGVGLMFIVGLYIFPTIMLLKFSNATRRSVQQEDQELFTAALRYQRNLYIYLGILMIVVIAIYVLVFLAFMASGARF